MADVVAAVQIEISLVEYLSLLDDQRWRQCVEGAGVDNWEGYSYAMEEFYSEEEDVD